MSSRHHPPSLQTPESVIYFLCRMESSYPNERIQFVTNVCNQFIARIDEYSLKHHHTSHHDSTSIAREKEKHRFYTDDDLYNTIHHTPFHRLLRLFAPYIIHNRFLCPFQDTQQTLSKLLHHMNHKLHLTIPISSPPYPLSGFLDLSSSATHTWPYTSDEDADGNGTELERIYTTFGRISHFELLISSHKDYLTDFNDLFHTLMNANNGPLGQEKRQYLGLMAASRYGCQPVIMQCELKYRILNGDMTWIKSGVNGAPSKYAKLAKINAILAHQPWLLTSQHIADLVHGNGAWTISECVQSFVILVMYHFLCGMYHGLCITPELDLYYASTLQDSDGLDDVTESFNHILTMDEDATNDKEGDNHEQDADEDEDEDQRSQNIAKLLSHTQQQLLQDEDIVGGKRQGFEQSACLTREMDSVSETPLLMSECASRSCFIKFRQLSDSGDNEDDENDGDSLLGDSPPSISMEYDPTMAPSSVSANESRVDTDNVSMKSITKEEDEKKGDLQSPPSEMHKLTSSNWKQLITLRKENMFALASDHSIQKDNAVISLYDAEELKLANITNPLKYNTNTNGASGHKGAQKWNKKRKYAKIKAPRSQGTRYWKYSLGIDMTYTDFDCHKNYQIHAYDFNWDKHGYALLSRYYPGIEKKMDAVFKTAYTMTDHCINNKDNLDTAPFRMAVRHYTFRLYGVHNDSYEYRFVNIYLPIKLKIFIKKLVCYPQIVTVDDVKKMGVALKEKEKIHIAILALEAKKQAALLFALRAIMKYMQSN